MCEKAVTTTQLAQASSARLHLFKILGGKWEKLVRDRSRDRCSIQATHMSNSSGTKSLAETSNWPIFDTLVILGFWNDRNYINAVDIKIDVAAKKWRCKRFTSKMSKGSVEIFTTWGAPSLGRFWKEPIGIAYRFSRILTAAHYFMFANYRFM